MGHRIPNGQEAATLRELIAEARATARDLRLAIREADALTPKLVTDYQAYHDRELKELANALTIEHNQVSRDLNASVETAKLMIINQIMAGEAIFDAHTSTVVIKFGPGAFDDQQQLPYPENPPKETPE